MKQLKFLMVAFTLLMGVSFTSCLNDDAGESISYSIIHAFSASQFPSFRQCAK